MRHDSVFHIEDTSNVGELRRAVLEMVKTMDFDDETSGRLSIISNEMTTNIIKHAHAVGKVLIRKLSIQNNLGVEIICMDKGVGIKNVTSALRDGYSTVGSMGTGLGAIRRLSDQFDIYSKPNMGTVMVSRVFKSHGTFKASQNACNLDIGVISVPKPGQLVCGDNWCIKDYQQKTVVLLVDGLGHGEGAAQAAWEAARIFTNNVRLDVEDIILKLHDGLKGTRGGVVAVARLDPANRYIYYAGVGNIAARILSNNKQQSLVSHEGIVGASIKRVQKFKYDWPENSILTMNTDGLITNIDAAKYPGLLTRSASMISGVLYRDHVRGNDDTAIIAVRNSRHRWDLNADNNSCY